METVNFLFGLIALVIITSIIVYVIRERYEYKQGEKRRSLGLPRQKSVWEEWPKTQRLRYIASVLSVKEYEISPFGKLENVDRHFDYSFLDNIFDDDELDGYIERLAYQEMRLRLVPLNDEQGNLIMYAREHSAYNYMHTNHHMLRLCYTARELGLQPVIQYRDGRVVG